MASYATPSILRPQQLNKTIKQVRVRNSALQEFFGGGIGGANVEQHPGRHFEWDVFDDVRKIASARTPAQPSARVAPQVVGTVRGDFPRVAETVPLLDEKIHNMRPIGGPAGDIDAAGMGYIARQTQALAQRVTNFREFQYAAMLRGSYTYTKVGDMLYHAFSGGTETINFRIPAGNLTTLDMSGSDAICTTGGTWATASNDIPLMLMKIDAMFQQLHGLPLKHILINSVGFMNVLNNTAVKGLAGSANRPFESMNAIEGTNDFKCVLAGMPWLTWHIINEVLDITTNGTSYTTTKLIADTQATFLPEPMSDVTQYWEGSEMVTEWTGGPRGERFGTYAWTKPVDDPSGYELKIISNGIPALFVPKAIATGTVVF